MSSSDKDHGGVRWFRGWRGWMLVSASLAAVLALFDLVDWCRWRYVGAPSTMQFDWHPNGRLAQVSVRQLRITGSEIVVELREDGSVDLERSYRTWHGLVHATPQAEHLELFRSNAVWGQIDSAGITWRLQDLYKASGRLPDVLPLYPGPAYRQLGPRVVPDRWGRPYVYEPPTVDHPPRITTFGKDGVPGGTGDDEDWTVTFRANGEMDYEWPFGTLEP
ncbi:MAG: type II secretion system protein GspG [Planctomycetes bacterium]|nr:type II secretion system protein GspG [Planctomycetota bacterium]